MPEDQKTETKVSETDTQTKTETKPEGDPKGDTKQPADETKAPKVEAKTAEELTLGGEAVDLDSMDETALLKHAGLDGKRDEMARAIMETGDLKPEHYAALKKIGVPKAMAKSYLALQMENAKGSIQKYLSEADAVAGGAEQHATVREWFKTNATPADVAEMDKMIRDNPAFYPRAVEIMAARFAKSAGGRSSNKPGFTTQPARAGVIPDDPKERAALFNRAAKGDAAARAQLKGVSLGEITKL